MDINEEVEDRKREVDELEHLKNRVGILAQLANALHDEVTHSHLAAMSRHNEAQERQMVALRREGEELQREIEREAAEG